MFYNNDNDNQLSIFLQQNNHTNLVASTNDLSVLLPQQLQYAFMASESNSLSYLPIYDPANFNKWQQAFKVALKNDLDLIIKGSYPPVRRSSSAIR